MAHRISLPLLTRNHYEKIYVPALCQEQVDIVKVQARTAYVNKEEIKDRVAEIPVTATASKPCHTTVFARVQAEIIDAVVDLGRYASSEILLPQQPFRVIMNNATIDCGVAPVRLICQTSMSHLRITRGLPIERVPSPFTLVAYKMPIDEEHTTDVVYDVSHVMLQPTHPILHHMPGKSVHIRPWSKYIDPHMLRYSIQPEVDMNNLVRYGNVALDPGTTCMIDIPVGVSVDDVRVVENLDMHRVLMPYQLIAMLEREYLPKLNQVAIDIIKLEAVTKARPNSTFRVPTVLTAEPRLITERYAVLCTHMQEGFHRVLIDLGNNAATEIILPQQPCCVSLNNARIDCTLGPVRLMCSTVITKLCVQRCPTEPNHAISFMMMAIKRQSCGICTGVVDFNVTHLLLQTSHPLMHSSPGDSMHTRSWCTDVIANAMYRPVNPPVVDAPVRYGAIEFYSLAAYTLDIPYGVNAEDVRFVEID